MTGDPAPDNVLDVDGVKVYFYTEEGEVRAVEGVSFSVPRGKILAIVGESGCGKSVTAYSILRLIQRPGEIMAGRITLRPADGKSVDITSLDERSDELGRRYASSKECHPYQLLTGDLVRMTELEGFDPDRSAFFTLNFDGSCRMSQYPLSFKLVLKRLGLAHIPIVAPSTSIRLDEATRLFGL